VGFNIVDFPYHLQIHKLTVHTATFFVPNKINYGVVPDILLHECKYGDLLTDLVGF